MTRTLCWAIAACSRARGTTDVSAVLPRVASARTRHTALQNKGAGAAPGFDVGFALMPVDATGAATGPDIPVGPAHAIVGLASGATTTLTSNVLIGDATGAIVAGIYRLRVIADPSNARPEADETNNTFLTGVLRVVPSDSL